MIEAWQGRHYRSVDEYYDKLVTVYHCTSDEAAASIVQSPVMFAGASGVFGAAIYFVETATSARRKARHGWSVVLESLVWIGRPVWLHQSWNDLNLETLRVMGCDSGVGSWFASGLEFAIYSNESIHGIQSCRRRCMGRRPSPARLQTAKTSWEWRPSESRCSR
jgi:hypothetical protein